MVFGFPAAVISVINRPDACISLQNLRLFHYYAREMFCFSVGQFGGVLNAFLLYVAIGARLLFSVQRHCDIMAALFEGPVEAILMSNAGVGGTKAVNKNSQTIQSIKAGSDVDRDISEQNRPLMREKRLLSNINIVGEDLQESSIRGLKEAWKHPAKWLYHLGMLLLLVVGIGLAIGHHLFYKSLHGTAIGSVSSQQWSLR